MKIRNAVMKCGAALAAVVASAGAMAQSSSYLPSSAAAGITQIQTDFTTLFGLTFAVMLFITGSVVAWKYTSKLGRKV